MSATPAHSQGPTRTLSLIADGAHARAGAYVSLAVVATAGVVDIGLPIADPLLGSPSPP